MYEELDAEKGTVEAVQGCIRLGGGGAVWQNVEERRYTSTPRSRNQGWWTEEVAKVVGEKREAWKMIEGIRDRGEQPFTGLKHGQKKKAARRAVDRARRSMEEELYRKLDEGGGKI